VNAVAPCLRTDVEHWISDTLGLSEEDLVFSDDA
jgi:hypothetical protein